MKSGYSSFEAFEREVMRRAEAKQDMVAKTQACALVPTMGTGLQIKVGRDRQYGINTTGHKQLAETVDIPWQYYQRMLDKEQELLARNVNTWFVKNPQERLLRVLDGNLRAVRSDKFRTDLEYEDLFQAVVPVLKELGVAIMSYQLTETKMYIKAVDGSVERELEAKGGRFGDGKHVIVRKLSPAITISDSEVGFGSASVLTGVHDSFCSNLATFSERSVRKYHVGARHMIGGDETYAMLSQRTKSLTAKATIAQISDVVRGAFSRAQFDALCDKVAETTTQPLPGDDVVAITMSASKRLGLNQDEAKGVVKHLIEGADLTKFGLYNAITRQAQDVEDYDRASELEQVGARIIDLPQSEWKIIERQAA